MPSVRYHLILPREKRSWSKRKTKTTGFSLIWFFGFTLIVHNKFIPRFHLKWLFKDILPILIFIIVLSYVVKNSIHVDISESRIIILLKFAILSVFFLIVSSISIPIIRYKLLKKVIG